MGGVHHRASKGVTEGRGSPSLTSEVVADTKCRQELVEVISKPWGGARWGFEEGAGGPEAEGGTGVEGTHQSGREEWLGGPQKIRGWCWGVRGSWGAAPLAGGQHWHVRGSWGPLPQAEGQCWGAGGHRGAALWAGGQCQPHTLQHSPAVQQHWGAAAHDALADAHNVLALWVTVGCEGSPGSPPGLPPPPRPVLTICRIPLFLSAGGRSWGTRCRDEHGGIVPSQLGGPCEEPPCSPSPLSPDFAPPPASLGHSPPAASLPAGHRAG